MLTAMVRERLAVLRESHGLTVTGMARAARQRQQDVSRFFNADMKFPPLDFLDALAKVFNVTLADILGMDATKPEVPEWQARVVIALKAMEAQERIAFETLLTRGRPANGTAPPRGRRGGRKG